MSRSRKKIAVTRSWNMKTQKAIVDENGEWMLGLSAPKACGPYYVTINQDTLHCLILK